MIRLGTLPKNPSNGCLRLTWAYYILGKGDNYLTLLKVLISSNLAFCNITKLYGSRGKRPNPCRHSSTSPPSRRWPWPSASSQARDRAVHLHTRARALDNAVSHAVCFKADLRGELAFATRAVAPSVRPLAVKLGSALSLRCL
eukprot:3346960-Pleurochrysis_carterae.AAC.3